MSKYSNTGTRIFVDQYDVSGFLNASSLDVKQKNPVVTTFSDTGPRRLPGNYDHSGSHGAFIDTADDSFDEYINTLFTDGADHYVCRLFGANAEGSIAYDTIVNLTGRAIPAAQGQAILVNLSEEGSNGVARGQVIRYATISGNGNGTGRNIGASTANQVFQVVFRVISGTFTTFDLHVEESTDDGSGDAYADVTGLSQTGITTTGVWRKTTTSATEAWKRLVISNWNGTSAVILVTAGIVAGT